MSDGPWYWCLQHQAVEPAAGCPNDHRLGPYDTREEAADAVAQARARTEQMDRLDEEWDGD